MKRTERPARWGAALLLGACTILGLLSAPAISQPYRLHAVPVLPLPRGADAAPVKASGSSAKQAARACPDAPRAMGDRKDIRKDWVIHVVYLLGADTADRHLDTNGTIECSMRSQQEWMEQETDLRWRLDTFRHDPPGRARPREMVDVSYLRAGANARDLTDLTVVQNELLTAGFDVERKRYLVYVEGGDPSPGGYCGLGEYMQTTVYPEPLDEDNPRYAAVFLQAPERCHADLFGVPGKPSWVEMVAQQEIMHNDNMVPVGAPHGCFPDLIPSHTCTPHLRDTPAADPERFDVMFRYAIVPLSEKKVDIGRDDYFRTPAPGPDLEDSPFLEGK